MFFHNIRIAWLSLRRNQTLSLLIVLGIALGIGVSTTFATVRHSIAKDPVPAKSGVLHYVRMDNWDPKAPYPGKDPTRPPTQVTYRDMVEIMKSKIPARQTGTFKSPLYVYPDPKVGRPFREIVRLVFSDFFPMFDVPFQHGGPWDKAADAGPEPVVVLSRDMNDKLFGGANSVGKSVRLEDREFRVVGVLAKWRPSTKAYDLTQNAVAPPEEIFMPFNFLRPMQLRTGGNSDGWISSPIPGFEGGLVSENCWIQMWVELPNTAAVSAYRDYLNAYVTEQKKKGRFQRPLNNRVTPLLDWMDEQEVVPPATTALLIVSLLFLAVCALNLVGLLLSKFLARASEVGVRRALGASRRDIFLQHVIECELVGVLGGAVGIALAFGSIAAMNTWVKGMLGRADLFRMDVPMLMIATGLSLLAGLIAGVYPAWRTCRIAPAVHLKVG